MENDITLEDITTTGSQDDHLLYMWEEDDEEDLNEFIELQATLRRQSNRRENKGIMG